MATRHLSQAPPGQQQQQQQQDALEDKPGSSRSNSTDDPGASLVSSPEPPPAENNTLPITLPPIEAAAAAACTQPQALAAGCALKGIPTSPNFRWPRCASNRTQLVWIAKACSLTAAGRNAYNTTSSSSSSVQYVELRAILKASGKLLRLAGANKACILTPDAARPGWSRNMFGGCGFAPGFATNLPTRVRLCGSSSSSPSPSGFNDSSVRVPRVPVLTGDTVPTSITQIEAVTSAGAPDSAAAAAGSGRRIVAAVMDSGIDASHWDIEYAGGKSFLTDDPDAGKDDLGHGGCYYIC
jgi:hypothetical protein